MSLHPTSKRLRFTWRALAALALATGLLAVLALLAEAPALSQAQTDEGDVVHIVARGDTMSEIAELYGVTVEDIVLANNLPDANYIFVGQRLTIPGTAELATPAVSETPTALPGVTPSPVATPTMEMTPAVLLTPTLPLCPFGCEAIAIVSPTMGLTVTSPLVITGTATGFDQELVVRVLDEEGFEIGLGYAPISSTGDLPAVYSATVTYTVPYANQLGRVQVYSLSSRDGAIEHLSSVEVNLQGSGLDPALTRLRSAVEAKDYDALTELLVEPWVLGFYRSEGITLDPEDVIEQLQRNYLGPGDVVVDLATDARALLGEEISFSPDVLYVLYSTGWGIDQVDDAFLLVTQDEEGQLRWGGLLYVFDALRDY